MIAVIDYGVGNLYSLTSSLKYIGAEVQVTNKAEDLKAAEKIILPGVGAFEDAIKKLRATGLVETLDAQVAAGKTLMGICLGMQLLFDVSYEYGEFEGLGYIKGSIIPMRDRVSSDLKIPQIGWNALHFPKDKPKSPLFRDVNEGDCVYFVHSYYAADCADSVSATTEYGIELTAAAESGNVFGTQFHPEKSGKVGLSILRAFCALE